MTRPRLFVITGAMAAGKSSVAEALAKRLPRAVHLKGDVFRRMIVSGRAAMGPKLTEEGQAQLALRHRLACDTARTYLAAGFDVAYQDILIGPHLRDVVERLADLEPSVVVLTASPDVLAARDYARAKTTYGPDFRPTVLADALERETDRIGFWIDTSAMTTEEVVDAILSA